MNTDASDQAEAYLSEHQETQHRFDQVVNLIEGFETPSCMELLATVHWVARYEGAATKEEAVTSVHAWNDRKTSFSDEHIRVAWDLLDRPSWLLSNGVN